MNKTTRHTFILFLVMFISASRLSGQGEFAGAKPKTLIGKMYNNEHSLPGLPGYEYRWVTVASEEKDPEQFVVGVFQKGSTWLVFYGYNNDSTTDKYRIQDVLIIKNVTSSQQVRTLMCRREKVSDIEIVALTQTGSGEIFPVLKAWRFNRNKRMFEAANTAGIDCVTELEN